MPLSEEERREAESKPDKLAIGVEGGFQTDAKNYRLEVEQVRTGQALSTLAGPPAPPVAAAAARGQQGCSSVPAASGDLVLDICSLWRLVVDSTAACQPCCLCHGEPVCARHSRCWLACPVMQALVLMPARIRIPLPCPDLPEVVLSCISAVQAHDSASHQVPQFAWHVGGLH